LFNIKIYNQITISEKNNYNKFFKHIFSFQKLSGVGYISQSNALIIMEEEYEKNNYESNNTYPMQAGDLKNNGYIVINGKCCKVIDFTLTKQGKHGATKANIIAIDIFTEKRFEVSYPSSVRVDIPVIKRNEYTIINIDSEGYCTLMDPSGKIRSDLKLPEDKVLAERITKMRSGGKEIAVTVVCAMGIDMIFECTEVI
jgi:translation initiation factor 5A